MSNGSLRREDLIIIPSLKRLITKEMNLIKLSLLQEVETIRLIPSGGEHIERDLSTNAVGKVEVGKLLLHCLDHIGAYTTFEVNLFVSVTFFAGAVTSDGTDVHHATAEFNECSPLLSSCVCVPMAHDSTFNQVVEELYKNGQC